MNDVMDLQNLGWSVSRTGGFEKAGYFPIRVAVLPAGHDPDSLLRAEGAAALHARGSTPRARCSRFVLERTLGEEDLGTTRGPGHRPCPRRPPALEGRRMPRRRPRWPARRRAGSAWTRPSSGSRPSSCRAPARGAAARPPRRTTGARSRGIGPDLAGPEPRTSGILLALLFTSKKRGPSFCRISKRSDRGAPGAARHPDGAPAGARGAAPEALMAELEGEAERGLLAALLVEEREWSDTQISVD